MEIVLFNNILTLPTRIYTNDVEQIKKLETMHYDFESLNRCYIWAKDEWINKNLAQLCVWLYVRTLTTKYRHYQHSYILNMNKCLSYVVLTLLYKDISINVLHNLRKMIKNLSTKFVFCKYLKRSSIEHIYVDVRIYTPDRYFEMIKIHNVCFNKKSSQSMPDYESYEFYKVGEMEKIQNILSFWIYIDRNDIDMTIFDKEYIDVKKFIKYDTIEFSRIRSLSNS